MGDLKGHALPGTFFLLFGYWWVFMSIRRFLRSRAAGSRYRSTVAFENPCSCAGRCRSFPTESVLKIVFPVIGMSVEILAHLPVPPTRIVQHATMYFVFGISGVLDMAIRRGVELPPGSDYLALALGLVVEGLLFANHLHGRAMLDVHIHKLLVYVIALSVLVVIVEAKMRHSPIVTISRGYLTMLQGTWFWAVGIILYGHGGEHLNTAWDMDKHDEVMLSTIYFTWHCAIHFIIVFVTCLVMACYYRQFNCCGSPGGEGHQGRLLKQMGNGSVDREKYSVLQIRDDVDEAVDIVTDEEL